ncbi:MAG: penicillin-binding protein 2 [bacterium]|nr:penicillin-binding protein 2 [bacterium]
MIKDPFIIQDNAISDKNLHDTPTTRWVEEIAPEGGIGFDYLKPSLKNRRVRIAYGALLSLLLLLAIRSAQLQIVKGKEYRAAAETNRIRIVRLSAPRGAIADRKGTLLTRNVPRFQITLNPLDMPRSASPREEVLAKLVQITNIPYDSLREAISLARLPVSPVPLATNLTIEEVYPFLIETQSIPGISVDIVSAREYVYGEEFSHLIGYLGNIGEQQKDDYLARGYQLSAMVGKSGLEASYEDYLRGVDGKSFVEVNAQGAPQTTVAFEEAISGGMLTLTVDAELQRKVSEVVKSYLASAKKTRASAIVMNPQTGGILAMVSLPSYDANLFSRGVARGEAYKALIENPDHPLFPRAIAGTYPSGSVIKPAIAAAALEDRIITAATTIFSAGGIRVGQWFFADWKAGGHGATNVIKAIAESVNTFFYTIGGGYEGFDGLGVDRIAHYLTGFGFGSPTGIDIPGEAKGLVPTPKWRTESTGQPWYIGDTYHLAIGQGDLTVTPLQIARMTSYFASGGKWVTPHLATKAQKQENKKAEDLGPEIDPANIQTVREGMRATVLYGSARSLQALPVTMAGKTGTAQWSNTKDTHAWFIGFAPYENPEIAITVLVEEGGEGSAIAVPIAREIVAWWAIHK